MKIKNVNGTSDKDCKCGTWIDHWKNFSHKSLPTTCPEVSCSDKDLVGAHVQLADSTNEKWHIIPLCKKHNGEKGKTLTVIDTALVPANKAETCG